MPPITQPSARHLLTAAVLSLVAPAPIQAADQKSEPEEQISIEDLLKSGWQVAGFTSTFDNRSAMILFRHPTETTLVQCLTGYDVTRTPRTYTNCYRLR
ncbi:hypothetical protein [uncultured Hyphomicrobium sp.]|uniref:hypothetical protein n=1 Tax=uncultured Hyphomicrobium sp. TaxID=194373 RepID=UPI0025E6EB3D|nr:hypothetical protein [uncultured Hyphomicrobium sp.]